MLSVYIRYLIYALNSIKQVLLLAISPRRRNRPREGRCIEALASDSKALFTRERLAASPHRQHESPFLHHSIAECRCFCCTLLALQAFVYVAVLQFSSGRSMAFEMKQTWVWSPHPPLTSSVILACFVLETNLWGRNCYCLILSLRNRGFREVSIPWPRSYLKYVEELHLNPGLSEGSDMLLVICLIYVIENIQSCNLVAGGSLRSHLIL